jgi:NAD(P)-dependent dehydrogenase (short-subunit alcohol dehydrogenase family)
LSSLRGKLVVVTGAAGNLGKAVVKEFLESGAIVFGLDHSKGRLDAYSQMPAYEGQFFTMEEVDVTDIDVIMSLAEEIKQNHGGIDILVNTVGGFTTDAGIHELDPKSFQRMMGLNVYSFLNVTKGFVPHMIKKKGGKVVCVGAKAGLKASANMGAYAASKAALMRLSESLAAELKPFNIQVNCVLPGIIDTPQNRKSMPKADFSAWVPPKKIAAVILFLASSKSDAITGGLIPVYGG